MKLPLALACASALAITVSSTASAAETLKLDLADPANAVAGGVTTQTAPLLAGQSYVVRVSGSGSLWRPSDFPSPAAWCGTPDTKPIMEPTPGAEATVAAVDPAMVFASPVGAFLYGRGACVDSNENDLPYASGLKLGTRGVLNPAVPIGGQPAAPNPAHTYLYKVTGDGTPLQFQFADVHAADNSGIFTIDVLSAAECSALRCLPESPVITSPPPAPAVSATCADKGKLSVRLVLKKGAKVKRASFYVNDRLRATVRGSKLMASDGSLKPQTLTRLPDGPLEIKAIVRLGDRKVLRLSTVGMACRGSDTPVALT
ncbi:MAG: hypothetical protein JHD16_13830 [Solirubrobacteraceae bacterium]|nr:hypothetical protein [Solirubrobacteraceae bacterium]